MDSICYIILYLCLNRILPPHLILEYFLSSSLFNTTPHSGQLWINWFPALGFTFETDWRFCTDLFFGRISRAISWAKAMLALALGWPRFLVDLWQHTTSHGISSAWYLCHCLGFLPISKVSAKLHASPLWLLYRRFPPRHRKIEKWGLHRAGCLNIILNLFRNRSSTSSFWFILRQNTFDVDFKFYCHFVIVATRWNLAVLSVSDPNLGESTASIADRLLKILGLVSPYKRLDWALCNNDRYTTTRLWLPVNQDL